MKLDTAPVVISAKDLPELKENAKSQLDAANIEPLQSVITESPKKRESTFVVFSTTFITIFLAEIGDKTQLSTLLMSAESHAPWVVFLGSAAALISTSLLGVLLGSWISSRLSPKTVEKSAGVMLLLISVMLFWDILQG
ncbi:TMEM165/GDT1 family protein [Nostoc sp. FACHB-87]|uniref:TMEM165/GDT1 family protein n=1 Tax=Nostocaceae TaxID=1162 RepID=UPI001683F797|nr:MULTISPECIES: TMEM165/GDT1 family protein [Nostocaceae]MBD2301169.1 TMEM165/GDT1 family protein [Nostoc sp. FACHB-190]MBD2456182.1 TMEM165/GDT1 family protein [Nostoc sp. FACHB-87]MBD2473934.1 TMEM165/GDT1 family protein [Anabaena sp. FACHB-83]